MIELTRINLLPYREEIKQRKQQQFKILMLGAFAVGLGLAAATYLGIDKRHQQSRRAQQLPANRNRQTR